MSEELEETLIDVLSFDKESAKSISDNISDENKRLRLSQILKSKRIADRSIDKQAFSIRWLHTYFLLESLLYFETGKKSERLRRLFNENLDREDKIQLLVGFTFSEKFSLGEEWYPTRHLMFNDFNHDDKFKDVYLMDIKVPMACSLNACLCEDWIMENTDKIDDYINDLVDKFREMRNSLVHESFPVLLLPSYEDKKTAASFVESVIDLYPLLEKDKFRAYECYLDPDIFFPIITKCIKNYIELNYKSA